MLILVRPRNGLGLAPMDKVRELVEGRLMVGHVGALCRGGVYIHFVYLWTSEGLSQRNRKIFTVLEEHVASHGRLWFAGGDFQILAEVPKTSAIL